MSRRSTPKPIPRSVLALLRHRWRTDNGAYSASDSVFYGSDELHDELNLDAEQAAKRRQYRRERQLDPAYYNFTADLDRSGLDHGQRFTHPEAVALMRDAVFDGVAEDQGSRIQINEHVVHALDDFCCEVYIAWAKCLDRLAMTRRACPIEQSKALEERDRAARSAQPEK